MLTTYNNYMHCKNQFFNMAYQYEEVSRHYIKITKTTTKSSNKDFSNKNYLTDIDNFTKI